MPLARVPSPALRTRRTPWCSRALTALRLAARPPSRTYTSSHHLEHTVPGTVPRGGEGESTEPRGASSTRGVLANTTQVLLPVTSRQSHALQTARDPSPTSPRFTCALVALAAPFALCTSLTITTHRPRRPHAHPPTRLMHMHMLDRSPTLQLAMRFATPSSPPHIAR